ncbi:MAG TPA: ACT domain-containing protein [bacterium]|nr:ACT domain-containing protein [bacterium]
MSKDLLVVLPDQPGTLAMMGEALAEAGVNIDGVSGVAVWNTGWIHILVKDAARARRALQAAGYEVREERDVLVVPVDDHPGALGALARKFAEAEVNVELTYLATNNRVVFGVNDLERARAAIE